MTFQSFHFAVFLSALALTGYFLRDKFETRKNVLLLASYYFYMVWDWRFAFILLWITLVNYFAGLGVEAARARGTTTRPWLWFGVGASLATLGLFKYFGFFVESVIALLEAAGLHANAPMLEILLPIGISFYTFQAISYTIDVHRGNVVLTRNFRDFALFVGFFATILSGPITRASTLLRQIQDPDSWKGVDAHEGLLLIARGLVKKVLFADVLAAHLVDPAFADPAAYSSAFLLIALYAYTFQIYMDLSGYTDMARGSAQIVGFRLPENFQRPYLASTLSNFWQRWHISMSSFFRDYLYFGIGGSRRGNVYRNLMITFVAIGLWHGAGWNFVFYGLIHGSIVCLERWRRTRRESRGLHSHGFTTWARGAILTFHIVVFSRLLFRSANGETAMNYIHALTLPDSTLTPLSIHGVAALVVALALHVIPTSYRDAGMSRIARTPLPMQGVGLMVLILVLLGFSTGEAPFVYFQF